ncbi:MAG: hypothetical protein PUB20_06720, partial [Clostridia bacterium]|nr:hypothetical protein [Clostridia bacterium]
EVVSAAADLADYTELDNSITAYEELESGKALYTADSWSAYEDAYNAAKSLARDLSADEQATVDSANAALVDAKAALAENSVVSATVANRGDTSVTVNVEVTGTPTALRLANSESSLTYNRTDATITTAENGNENWEIEVAASGAANSYTVSALYGTAVANQTATFSYDALKDPNFISLDIPGAYSEEGYKDRVYKGKNEMKVVTTQDVWKIQFVQDGGTYTYATDYTPYVDNEDGTRTWTINHVFGPVGDVHLDIRIRLRNTSFYNVNESIDVEVVY